MKPSTPPIKRILIKLAVAALMAAPNAAVAGDAQFKAAPDSKLWLDGNSTLHKFKSSATKMNISLTLSPADAAPADAVKKGAAKTIDVVIPVEGLKSGEKGLDKNMYKALKADKYPEIRFQMSRYEITKSADGLPAAAKATGKLTIDGVEKEIAMNPELIFSSTTIRIRGSQEILMKDYGVEPPTLMLGAIKVDNRIVIGYDLVMAP